MFPTQSTVSDISKDINLDESAKPLSDSISDISWITNQVQPVFATTEWKGDFRIFEITNNNNKACLASRLCIETKSPLVCCNWMNDNSADLLGFGNG